MHLPVGAILQGGTYRILRFLSSGGFGCTYEAEHVMLGSKVAIKEFYVKDFCNRDELTGYVSVGASSKKGLVDKLRRKFIEEAQALSQLQHPNIVHVSDVFEENGTAYFVMDFIEGSSLSEILKKEGHLSEQKALKYICQVAEALRYVHARNRLHLDIKPGNIMVDKQDNAVLIDFGASKQYDEENGENTSTLIGKTPGYAPLEQMGNDVTKFTPATDIYSLGATLYKLLTGITPLSATLLASGDALSPLPNTISKNVVDAVTTSMQIKKKDRPQSVEDFLLLLGYNSSTTDDPDTELDINIVPQRAEREVKESSTKEIGSFFSKHIILTVVVGICVVLAIVVLVYYSVDNSSSRSIHSSHKIHRSFTTDDSQEEEEDEDEEEDEEDAYDAYHEGYEEGYEQGEYDGRNGYIHGFEYDDYSSYDGYSEERYKEGYEAGYDEGYTMGYSQYEEEEDSRDDYNYNYNYNYGYDDDEEEDDW